MDTAVPHRLRDAVRLAREVGRVLVEMQHGSLDARAKSDGSPLTQADRAAHAMLAHALPDIAPYPVVSEESEPHENAGCSQAQCLWIVDPLDGTRGYVAGSAEFTVNMALVEGGTPILGVIDAPALGVTYYASSGAGAYRAVRGEAPTAIRCCSADGQSGRIVVSSSDIGACWSGVAGLATVRVEALSSAVKFGLVAEGSALAYPRLTQSCEWDVAAGHAIVAEAGGRVIGADGGDLRYNKADTLNGPFVASALPAIAEQLLKMLAPSG